MVPGSFEYSRPVFIPDESYEPPVCPHCKQPIQPGDNVHWYGDTLWHTKPCPT
jgi:NAD-dependent SIR2 family protein deacetylase